MRLSTWVSYRENDRLGLGEFTTEWIPSSEPFACITELFALSEKRHPHTQHGTCHRTLWKRLSGPAEINLVISFPEPHVVLPIEPQSILPKKKSLLGQKLPHYSGLLCRPSEGKVFHLWVSGQLWKQLLLLYFPDTQGTGFISRWQVIRIYWLPGNALVTVPQLPSKNYRYPQNDIAPLGVADSGELSYECRQLLIASVISCLFICQAMRHALQIHCLAELLQLLTMIIFT